MDNCKMDQCKVLKIYQLNNHLKNNKNKRNYTSKSGGECGWRRGRVFIYKKGISQALH